MKNTYFIQMMHFKEINRLTLHWVYCLKGVTTSLTSINFPHRENLNNLYIKKIYEKV